MRRMLLLTIIEIELIKKNLHSIGFNFTNAIISWQMISLKWSWAPIGWGNVPILREATAKTIKPQLSYTSTMPICFPASSLHLLWFLRYRKLFPIQQNPVHPQTHWISTPHLPIALQLPKMSSFFQTTCSNDTAHRSMIPRDICAVKCWLKT